MATEVLRQVWCDIHLKAKKKKVEGTEKRATALHEGTVISLDLCDECYAALTWKEVLTYGSREDQPKFDKAKLSERIKDVKSPKGGRRPLVECSFCGKQLTAGAGWALHNKVHERNKEAANPVPVAS
jgi:hypothetical protein